jgi:hypothetical protein
MAEQVALAEIDPETQQRVALDVGFDAFGDDAGVREGGEMVDAATSA